MVVIDSDVDLIHKRKSVYLRNLGTSFPSRNVNIQAQLDIYTSLEVSLCALRTQFP